MVYSFYFLLVGSRRNERNSLFGEKKGARSEDCGLFWYCLRYAVNDDKMISPAIIVYNKFTTITFLLDDIPSEQVEVFWPLPLILSKDYWIHSFWSQNTEKRNTAISQMRLRSVSKMQISILNTATTEQMGYGIISFFVCFPLMNQIVIIRSVF